MTIELRDATPGDAAAIKEVFDEHSLAAFGEVAMAEEEIRSWFAMPNIWMQLAERDGRVVGYLDITSEESGHLSVDARTLDAGSRAGAARGSGGARTRAREDADSAWVRPGSRAGAAAGLRGRRVDADPALLPDADRARWRPPRAGLAGRARAEERRARRGGARLRGAHGRLRRPLGLPPPAAGGLARLFDRHPPLRPVALVAGRGRGRAGGDLDERVGLLGRSAVRLDPGARRAAALAQRGLATALLRHSFRDFRGRGATKVGLGVDGENTTGAVRLYESVGMRQVRRSDTYEKTL